MTLRRISLQALLAATLIGGFGIVQAATIYRWVDERGRVHFSDQRSSGAGSIEVKPGSGATPPVDEPQPQHGAECERRKNQLEAYRNAASVVETDALGQRHEYDPAEKTRLLQLGEQQVLNACGSPGV
jgi:hypothetical protein